MSLIQIIYASTACDNLSVDAVRDIVDFAATNNRRVNISGFMCANSKYFLQCLEGESMVLDALYKKIEGDPRHHALKLIQKEEISDRDFEQWSMGVVLTIERHEDILQCFFGGSEFDPYKLSSGQAKNLLKQFSQLKTPRKSR